MARDIEITGFAELENALKQLPDIVARKLLQQSMRKGADIIRAEAQSRAPVRHEVGAKEIRARKRSKLHGKGRLPGFLKANIVARLRQATGIAGTGGATLTYSIGWSKDAFYGMFNEFGTRHQPARPFLRPAIDTKSEAAVAAIGQALGPKIEQEFSRMTLRGSR